MGTFLQHFRKRIQETHRSHDPVEFLFVPVLCAVLGGLLPVTLLGDSGLGKALAGVGVAFGFVLGLLIYGTLGAFAGALMDSIQEGLRSRFGRVGASVLPALLGALVGGMLGHALGSLRELNSPTMGTVVGGLVGSLVVLAIALVRR